MFCSHQSRSWFLNAHGSSNLAGQKYAHSLILTLAIQLKDHVV
uniref:Uncharacterized protein n=1 Tax=Aegilops tauschii subsp. strangulata TaxID=200361 RepID=A0A453MBA0_AEGTS